METEELELDSNRSARLMKEVVGKVLDGDVEAFAAVVEQFQGEIFRIVSYTLEDRTKTEDLVQQVFVNTYLNIGQYDPSLDFGKWIRTLARNLVRNEIRRERRENRWMRSYYQWLSVRLQSSSKALEAEQAMRRHLEECFKKLPDTAFKAIELRYRQAYGFDRIGELLDRSGVAVQKLISRTRMILGTCVEKKRSALA